MVCRYAWSLTVAAVLLTMTVASGQGSATSWLDQKLSPWNIAGAQLPGAPSADETNESIVNRCRLTPPRSTAAERAVAAAGWIPFWNVDQQLVRDDIEVVGGMRGADGMCRPALYNLF